MVKFGSFKGIISIIKAFSKSHAPELLIGFGIAGMATGTFMAVGVTPKVTKKIEKAIDDINEQLMDAAVANKEELYSPITKLKRGDIIKLCWKDYLPAAVTGVASVICIVGGTNINLRRNAALITACKLSEVTIKDLREYKNKAAEIIGTEKSDEIESKIDKEHLDKASENIDASVISGNGPILYFDKLGGQWFRSDRETIRAALNRLNHMMNNDLCVSLNDLYSELDMPNTIVGNELGWNTSHGLIEARFSSQLTNSGTPVAVFSTRVDPMIRYNEL